MTPSRTLPIARLSDIQESNADAFEDATEAYGDGIVTCFSCGISGKPEEFESCAWGGCPMFESEQ